MSIFTEVKRIFDLRNAISTKLLSLKLVETNADLETCKSAIVGIADHTGKTKDGEFTKGETGYITGRVLEKGYYDEASELKIPVANFAAENIKKDVTMGGLTGILEPEHSGTLSFKIYSSGNIMITTRDGVIYKYSADGNVITGNIQFRGNFIHVYSVGVKKYSGCTGCRTFTNGVNYSYYVEISSDNPYLELLRY